VTDKQAIARILQLAQEHLSDDDMARAAGKLMDEAGVNRPTVSVFLHAMSECNREEMLMQAEDLANEADNPDVPPEDYEDDQEEVES
jgi:hypothetical protein